jgi:nicotinamide-nucleotide amidase
MNKTVSLLIKTLKEKKLTLAMAESMTCGLAAHKLSTCPGTSDVFAGSVVCYTPEVKKSLFRIPQTRIDRYSCESKEITEILAKNLSGLIKADIYGAITGLASAGGSETKDKPVGTVFFAVSYKNKVYHLKKLFRGTPLEIRTKACMALFEFILSIITT